MFRGVFPYEDKLEALAEMLGEEPESLHLDNNLAEPIGLYGKKLCFSFDELIPYYETDPHIGLTEIWNGTGEISPKDHIYLPGLNADLVFPYYGRGMEPQLDNGDWIVLRKVSDLSFFNYGNLHVVITKEQVIVRNLNKSKNDQSVLLCAQDPNNDLIELPKKSIKALFAVITVIKRRMI